MLDKIDQRIVQELQENGRKSYTELGKMLGVTEGTIRRRVKGLQNRGVIKIRAVLDPRQLGYNHISMMAIQIRIADMKHIGDLLAREPNVLYLAFVAGRWDMVALVATKTSEDLGTFIKEHISGVESIVRTETLVNLEIIKSSWIGASDLIGVSNST